MILLRIKKYSRNYWFMRASGSDVDIANCKIRDTDFTKIFILVIANVNQVTTLRF